MDGMLTLKEIRAAKEQGYKEAEECGAAGEWDDEYAEFAIAKATAWKVVEWIESHAQKGVIESLGNNWYGEKLVAIKQTDWQALVAGL